jgi:hypothetical protein
MTRSLDTSFLVALKVNSHENDFVVFGSFTFPK